MTKLSIAFAATILASPAFASSPTVPEIDALSGIAAIAAVGAVVALIRERSRH